jgi:hypothetical protein
MESLSKKSGYLKGLIEALDFDRESPNGKLTAGIVELLSLLTDRVEAMDDLLDDLNDYVESIDDDLAELEGERDDEFGFDDGDDPDFDDAYGAGEDKLHLLRPDEGPKDAPDAPPEPPRQERPLAGKLCPQCKRMFFTALEDPEDAEYQCPHCGQRIRPVPLTPENAPIAQPIQGK